MSVKRDVAEATRPELGGAYEGCLDQFERGMSTERLREVFAELKSGLVPLLRAIQEKVAYQLYFRFIEPPQDVPETSVPMHSLRMEAVSANEEHAYVGGVTGVAIVFHAGLGIGWG